MIITFFINYSILFLIIRKFVSKNQKPKTPINEVNFTDGAPEGENKCKYKINSMNINLFLKM